MKLNNAKIKALKPRDKLYRVADGGGLVIEIKPNGKKVWRVRYRFAGKAKMFTVGEYPAVSLSKAREILIEVKRLLQDGVDPVMHKRETKRQEMLESLFFKDVVTEFLDFKGKEWSKAYMKKQMIRIDNYIAPLYGYKIKDIDKSVVVKTIKDVKRIKTLTTKQTEKIETQKKIFNLLNQIFRFALHNDYIDANPLDKIDKNEIIPKSSTTNLKAITNLDELRVLYRAIVEDYRGYDIIKNALMFLALSALRPGNVRNLEWDFVDLKKRVITFPADKMKMRKEFRLPLSSHLLYILENMQEITYCRSKYVFCSPFNTTKQLSENTLNIAIKRLGFSNHNAHGFRSSFSTIAYEMQKEHKFGSEVIESALAHAIGSATTRAYLRGDFLEDRRGLLEWWGGVLKEF